MGSCAAPSAKGDDKFITTDYLQQCLIVSGGLPKTIKAGLQLKGVAAGAPRKPLTKATDIELNQLKQLLSEIEN